MMTVVAGLEQGTTALDKVYRDSGRMRLDNGESKITDADNLAMGSMPLEDGIAYSRNIVAAKVALGLAPTTRKASSILHEVWTRLGFGRPTGIDVAGEVRGLVNDPSITPWRQIDLANGSFGQGVAVTQLQLATRVRGHGQRRRARAAPRRRGNRRGAGRGDPRRAGPRPAAERRPRRRCWSTSSRARGTRPSRRSRATGSAARPGTAQVWDAENKRWFFNIYNFSCVGFIGREEGHPDLVVAVKIGEAPPNRNALGQFFLPVTSTELFRRVATDAIGTPGLLPVSDPGGQVTALVGQ